MRPISTAEHARVLVRRGPARTEFWLDDEEVRASGPSGFDPDEEQQILELLRDNVDDLLSRWIGLKDDVRRGRLSRNPMVE